MQAAEAARLTRQKQIGDHIYSISLLSTEAGEEPLVRLIELLGPAVVDALSSPQMLEIIAGAASADRKLDANVLGELAKPLAEAARGVISRLRRDDLTYFVGVFKGHTTVTKVGARDGVKLSEVYSVHFSGRFGALREWLTFCLMENYRDFFGGGGGILSALAAPRAAATAE